MSAENKIKWNTRQRLQYIEIMAFYSGVVTRSDVARAFDISDAAATKDLKLYGQLAPDNLFYRQNVFGFVPGPDFREVMADLSPAAVLPMIAANLPSTSGPYGQALIYGIPFDTLPAPSRLPGRDILAQVTRAIHHQRKLQISYRSLSDRDNEETRLIEPHSLVNTGLRWHVRAYNEDSFDFRDFVLSRIQAAEMLEQEAESRAEYDEEWSETIELELAPHPALPERKQKNLLMDYGANDNSIRLVVRRALIGYTLQKLSVDTTADHSLNPNAYHLVIVNRDEIEAYAGWAFQ